MVEVHDAWTQHSANLASARLSAGTLDGVQIATWLGSDSDAYALQSRVNEVLCDELGPVVGYKVGLTSADQRRQLGVPEPVFGAMHARRRYGDHPLIVGGGGRPFGVECEVALTLGEDLVPEGAPYDSARVGAAVVSTHPAIEIVQNRFADLRSTPVVSLIADAALHHGYVLGEGIGHLPSKAASITGTLWSGDRVLARGDMGSMYLGHPLEALTWLANKRASLGLALSAGDVVLCGSFVPIQWMDPASLSDDPIEVRADFDGMLPDCILRIAH